MFVTQPGPTKKKTNKQTNWLSFPKPMNRSVLTDGKLIINNERGISSVNVWLTVSDSSSLLHLILPSAFNSIHLLSVSASKSGSPPPTQHSTV